MKVLILAGGYGTRLGEETNVKPKPMVEIGGYPILWHIMKLYSHYGFDDFVVLCGYRGEMIKRWFVDYCYEHSDVTVDLATNEVKIHRKHDERWKVTMLDTGVGAMTGSRIRKAREYVGDEPFLLTYGDGLADVDIPATIECHRKSGKLVTLTAVQPSGRWGVLSMDSDGAVNEFEEKPDGNGGWINGGFFVCNPGAFDYIGEGDSVIWERDPLRRLVADGQLNAYRHRGFWQPVDMLRDKILLNKLWDDGQAPWKVWA